MWMRPTPPPERRELETLDRYRKRGVYAIYYYWDWQNKRWMSRQYMFDPPKAVQGADGPVQIP